MESLYDEYYPKKLDKLFLDLDVEGFIAFLRTAQKLSDLSIMNQLERLHSFRKYQYKLPLSVFDVHELELAVSKIHLRLKTNNSRNGARGAIWHWYEFYKHTTDLDKATKLELDEKVRKILGTEAPNARIVSDKEDLLTIDDIITLCSSNKISPKYKAIISLKWDVSPRPLETCKFRVGDVGCDDDGYYIRFGTRAKSKRRQTHYLAFWSTFKWFVPYWKSKSDPSAPLFPMDDGSERLPSTFNPAMWHYKKIIGKHVYPYLFRESGPTFMVRHKMISIPGARHRMDHKKESTTFEKHYFMMYSDDFNDEIFAATGRKPKEIAPYIQRFCQSCLYINPPGATECFNCRTVLDETHDDYGRIEAKDVLAQENEELRKRLEVAESELVKKEDHEERIRKIEEEIGMHEADDLFEEALEMKEGQKP